MNCTKAKNQCKILLWWSAPAEGQGRKGSWPGLRDLAFHRVSFNVGPRHTKAYMTLYKRFLKLHKISRRRCWWFVWSSERRWWEKRVSYCFTLQFLWIFGIFLFCIGDEWEVVRKEYYVVPTVMSIIRFYLNKFKIFFFLFPRGFCVISILLECHSRCMYTTIFWGRSKLLIECNTWN